ncbi:MAG: hypothetical protein AB2A00_28500 [Myxococcota bacterium]
MLRRILLAGLITVVVVGCGPTTSGTTTTATSSTSSASSSSGVASTSATPGSSVSSGTAASSGSSSSASAASSSATTSSSNAVVSSSSSSGNGAVSSSSSSGGGAPESEPNDDASTASALVDAARGELSTLEDWDYFSLVVTEGTFLTASVTTSSPPCGSESNTSGADTFLELVGSNGTEGLALNDNRHNTNDYCSHLSRLGPLRAGTYYLAVSSNVEAVTSYTLSVVTEALALSEDDENENLSQADPFTDGWRGTVFPGDDVDYVTFNVAQAGSSATVEVTDDGTGDCYGALDSYLAVHDAYDVELASDDDIEDYVNTCSRVELTGLAAGAYHVVVSSLFFNPFHYGLTITVTP